MVPRHRAIGQAILPQRIVGRRRYLFGPDWKLIGFATSNGQVLTEAGERSGVPVGNLIRLAREAESRNASVL